MASQDNISMALFCDFENVALGVRDANYQKFDIKRVLERLLLKGSIVVKKAYCDWDRYKQFKGTMHEANFELIEIPHVRQSGKNSADIRLVVDALDLCYTKSHVNTFVIISGDSDFSPLVSKLRENAKQVIGVGVKQSTSDLLIANCDEFIFYDDLVREHERSNPPRRNDKDAPPAPRRTQADEQRRKEEAEAKVHRALDLVVSTLEALLGDRGEGGKVRASLLKDAIKRRKPDFSENRYGFKTFTALLEEAQACGLVEIERDEKSNVYLYRNGRPTPAPLPAEPAEPAPKQEPAPRAEAAPEVPSAQEEVEVDSPAPARAAGKRAGKTRRGRGRAAEASDAATNMPAEAPAVEAVAPEPEPVETAPELAPAPDAAAKTPRPRRPRKPRAPKDAA